MKSRKKSLPLMSRAGKELSGWHHGEVVYVGSQKSIRNFEELLLARSDAAFYQEFIGGFEEPVLGTSCMSFSQLAAEIMRKAVDHPVAFDFEHGGTGMDTRCCTSLAAVVVRKEFDVSGILASDGLQVENVPKVTRDTVRDLYENPQKVFSMTPTNFEALVAELTRGCGWQAVLTKQSHDDGVDVWLDRSDSGIPFTVIVQCKHKRTPNRRVGVPEIRALLGTVKQHDVPMGILVTTGRFTREAARLLKRFAMRLKGIDFHGLLNLMQRYLGFDLTSPCTV